MTRKRVEEIPAILSKEGRLGRTNDDSFLIAFAELYDKYKAKGMLPVEITRTVMEKIDCSNSRYYAYLRAARAKGFIKDSYEENMGKYVNRMQLKWDKFRQLAGATRKMRLNNPSWCDYVVGIFTKRKK